MSTYSLDQLRADVERDFQPVIITLADGDEIALRNLLRLPRKDRDRVMAVLKTLEDINTTPDEADAEDVDNLVDVASEVLTLVADNGGKRLIKEIDGDLTLTMRVLETWMKSSSVGEANSSPS